jgi:hypothetical protein
LKEAQKEISFALIIDPTNAHAVRLQREIAKQEEELKLAEMERRRRAEEERQRQEEERRLKEEEELRRAEELRASLQEAVESAKQAAAAGDFGGALKIITCAYVLDARPTSCTHARNGHDAKRRSVARENWLFRRSVSSKGGRRRKKYVIG